MLTELLKQRPIIQAPMAGVQDSDLTVAVCEAGGIGSLPGAMLGVDALRAALQQINDGTDKPHNINFFCHRQPAKSDEEQKRWLSVLAPYYEELGADSNVPAGPARAPFSAEALAVLQEFKPKIISFHFGLPSTELLEGVKEMGSFVLGCATSVAEAEWLQAQGADGVIAQGIQAGGHQGRFLPESEGVELPCLDLVRLISEAISLPVIAAGGIANRSDALAAVEAGAVAVQIGSAYLQADEAKTTALHRAALQSGAARSTVLTNVFSGRRARGIVNRAITELGPMSDSPPAFPYAAEAMAPLRSAAEAQGSGDFSPLWSGEQGYRSEARSAAEITRAINPLR